MDFEDEKQAKIWIPASQVPRRNIEPFRRLEFLSERDKLKKLREKRLKKRSKNLNNNPASKMADNRNTTDGSALDLTNLVNSRTDSDEISDEN